MQKLKNKFDETLNEINKIDSYDFYEEQEIKNRIKDTRWHYKTSRGWNYKRRGSYWWTWKCYKW